ncbi:MAG: MFS transporter [Lentisphaeria bacterium]|nr:MFS transporter [Lentisphaeria bacterium]
MSAFAETLTEAQRKRARIYAYFACYFGCISEVMLDSSAIVIIYLSMLGGSSMLIMLATSFSGILSMFLLIPSAALIGRIGMRKGVLIACCIGCAGFLLMASAPAFGAFSKVVAMTGCLIYCMQRSLYCAAWYPMLDAFLRPQDRGSFFGTMRYTYMIVTGVLFFYLGKVMGKNPPMLLMQCVIGGAGICLLGRLYCMWQFPVNPMENTAKLNVRHSLGISIRNGPLTSYAVYLCLLSIAFTSLVPVTLLYLKEYVGLAAGTVQVFSTVGIAGSIVGYFCYGWLLKHLKIKRMELLTHFTFIFVAFSLFLLHKGIPYFLWIAGFVYFMLFFASSAFMCNNSTELLALARPGNKPMAMAFQQTYQNFGISVGRTGTSLILGAHLLAPTWTFAGMEICSFQTLFLLYGVIATVVLVLIPTLPAIVPKHHDYYEPSR